jgi:hypothetical protein
MPRSISARTKNYVRRAAEAQFDCAVRIYRNSAPTFNQTTGEYEPVNSDVYTGPARIWSVDSGGTLVVGETAYPLRVTYCSIPWDSTPMPINDDIVEITSSPDDPYLVGRSFLVSSVDGGGQARATRRMQIVNIGERWPHD